LLAVTAARWLACEFGAVTQVQAYVLPYFRVDSLLVGVVCAMFVRWERGREWLGKRGWLLLIPVAIAAGLVWTLDLSLPERTVTRATPIMTYGLTLVALGYACLLLLALARPQWGLGALLRTRPLRFMGRVSYFVYLVHWGVLKTTSLLVHELAPSSGRGVLLGAMVAAMAITLLIAEISWRFFESRMLAIGYRAKYGRPQRAIPVEPARVALVQSAVITASDSSALGQTSEAA
jgi:peptidoglycan/LPS O-acetylase OafA/YrhL